MGKDVLMLIVFGVMLAVIGVYYLHSKKQKATPSTNKTSVKSTNDNNKIEGIKRQEKTVEQKDMSGFIKFDKIANDMIYQNNGERYSMVIRCKGINYNLMSEIEQMAVEESFIMFLNTLKFPIQLYVQTRSIDLSENVKTYKERVQGFINKQNEMTAKYNELEDDIDSTQDEIDYMKKEAIKYTNIAEYASDITRYVERMAMNKYMLQRSFYVIISYNKSELATTEKFSKQEYEDMCYRELYTRAQGIIGSLMGCSVMGSVLSSNELAQLVYVSFNKDDSNIMNIKDALESGIFRLYTSSEDVMKKKRQMIDEELTEQSRLRVEEAVREAIEKGLLLSEDEANEEMKKEIDRRAIKIIDKSSVNQETKQILKNTIKEDRKQRVEELREKKRKVAEELQIQMETENASEGESNETTNEILTEEVNVNEQKEGEIGNE